jgi:hypothetical protein
VFQFISDVKHEAKHHRISVIHVRKYRERRLSIGFEPHCEPLSVGHDPGDVAVLDSDLFLSAS